MGPLIEALNNKGTMKISLRIIGLLGFLIFAGLFGLTFGVPDLVEESAKGFVKTQIEKEIRDKYQDSKAKSVLEKVTVIHKGLDKEQLGIQRAIDYKLPEKIAQVIASLCGYDCERQKGITKSIKDRYIERIEKIELAQHKLTDIIKGKYVEIIENLKADLRVFLGANASMFVLILLLSFLRSSAIAHLFVPSVLLVVATIAASSIYLFGQDWFYTILYNNYVGFGYLVYLGLIFGFLIDVAFNKGRVTKAVVNYILNAIGSAVSIGPC